MLTSGITKVEERVERAPIVALAVLAATLLVATGGCNAVRYGLPMPGSGTGGSEVTLSLGPLDLAPRTEHFDAPQPDPLHAAFPVSGWMHGFTIEIVDADGRIVPDEVLHHIKVLMPRKRELFMPISLRLMGAGSETKSASIPRSMGIPFQKGDSILLTAMVHNPTGQNLDGVEIRLRLQHTGAPALQKPGSVYPFFLHVAPPDAPAGYDLPPGYSERSWEARPGVEGHIVALGGHLHRYGLTLRLENLTTGREIWRSHARSDALGNILEIPRTTYTWSRGPLLHPDHVYRITASYFNPTADVIEEGGMGTIGGVFRPVGDWPVAHLDHPLYVFDLHREISGGHGEGHGHGGGRGDAHGGHRHDE